MANQSFSWTIFIKNSLRIMFFLVLASCIGYALATLPRMLLRTHRVHEYQQASSRRTQLKLNEIDAYDQYEMAISQYTNAPTDSNKATVKRAFYQLQKNFQVLTKVYGLPVKRWVTFFNVWAQTAETKLLTHLQLSNTSLWDLNFSAFHLKISDAMDKVNRHFRDHWLEAIANPTWHWSYHVNTSTMKKVKSLYNSKAKVLIPIAKKQLEDRNSLFKIYMSPVNIHSAKSIANHIALIQYGTRLPIGMLGIAARQWCNPSHQSSASEGMLAVCQIAKERIKTEMQQAKQRYGKLSQSVYFNKFVRPLIPKYRKQLAKTEKGRGKKTLAQLNACDPSNQPIISFRDPDIDAQIAAYQLYGYQYCQEYFKNSSDPYAQVQQLRYRKILRN